MAVPTERQLAWAMSLGVELYAGLDRETLSEMIDDSMQTMDDEPPNRWQLLVGEEWGEEVYDEDEMRGDFASRLFQFWEDYPEDCEVPHKIEQQLTRGRKTSPTATSSRVRRNTPTPEEREAAERLAAQQAKARRELERQAIVERQARAEKHREQRRKIVAAMNRATVSGCRSVARHVKNGCQFGNRLATALSGDDAFMLRFYQALLAAAALLVVAILLYAAFELIGIR